MSKGRNKKAAVSNPSPSSKQYMRRKIIMVAIIVILGLILYIDSNTNFIENMVGNKTFEIRIKK